MRRIYSVFAFLLICQSLLMAQKVDSVKSRLWIPRDFGRFLLADMYSPVTKLQVGYGNNGADYNNNPQRLSSRILVGEFTLGSEIPVYSGSFRLAHQNYRFSLASSVSAVVWFDFLNKVSAPILDVDYRLEVMNFLLLKEFKGRRLKNALLRISFLQHESTHIGDEITLYRKTAGFPATRINLAYESGEVSLSLNDPAGKISNNHAFTLGSRFLYKNDKNDGYYIIHPWEGDPSFSVPSSRKIEPYIRYQWDYPTGLLRIGRFYPVFSAELRQRIKFGYSYFETDPTSTTGYREIRVPEKYLPCLNLYVGLRDQGKPGQAGKIGGYLRYYAGINPYGQFRNIPSYSFLGFAMVYEI